MLPLFRQKREWLKWVLLLVILALGFTTVLLFVNTPQGLAPGIGAREVAVVAGKPITAAQFGIYYRRLVDTYRQVYNLTGENEALIDQFQLEQRALNQLINRYAGAHAADQLGLGVATSELVQSIADAFQENGQFVGTERYKEILRANNWTPKEYEDWLRLDLMNEKLARVLTDGISATAMEARASYVERNEQVKIRYVTFDPAELGKEEATEEALKDYYSQKQDTFRKGEQRLVSYISALVKPADVTITPEQVAARLAETPGGESVRVRHILIRDMGNENEARVKAEEVLKEVRAGKDFAQLAATYSDDTQTALRGGDLGYFGRGQMVPEFEEAAFALEPGQSSGLVRSPFGFHILESLDKITESDEAARRPFAEFLVRRDEALRQSEALAGELYAEIQKSSFDEVAQKHGLEVSKTGWFDMRTEQIPGIGLGQQFIQEIFTKEIGAVTGPYVSAGQYQIVRLDEVKPGYIPEFSEVRDEVVRQFETEKGQVLASQRANEFYEAARAAGSFETVAGQQKLQPTETDFFRRGGMVSPDLAYVPVVSEQAFGLAAGEVAAPISASGKFIVFQVVEKQGIDEAQFELEKDLMIEQLSQQKRADFLRSYLENVVSQLRKNDQLVINQQLFQELTGKTI